MCIDEFCLYICSMKICGIYKITSPSSKIYIGQSIDINRRMNQYRRIDTNVSKSIKLYNSLNKYGFDNHIFEIIEECSIEDLNTRERYWQDFYEVTDNMGLNCVLVETNTKRKIMSQETREKISKNNAKYWKGKKIPRESVELGKKNRIYTEEYRKKIGDKSKGRIKSEETREKMRQKMLGKKHTDETKLKMSLAVTGRKHSEETKLKISIIKKGTTLSEESRKNVSLNSRAKEVNGVKVNVYCYETNVLLNSFDSITDASRELGCLVTSICNNLSGLSKKVINKKTNQKLIFKKI